MLGYIFVPEGKVLKKSKPYYEFVGPVIVTNHRLLNADPKFTDGTDYDIYTNLEEVKFLQEEDKQKNRQSKDDQIDLARKALKSAAEEVEEEVEKEEIVICDECDNELDECPCDE